MNKYYKYNFGKFVTLIKLYYIKTNQKIVSSNIYSITISPNTIISKKDLQLFTQKTFNYWNEMQNLKNISCTNVGLKFYIFGYLSLNSSNFF